MGRFDLFATRRVPAFLIIEDQAVVIFASAGLPDFDTVGVRISGRGVGRVSTAAGGRLHLESLFDHLEIGGAGDDAGEVPVVEDECISVIGVFVDLCDLLPVDDVGLLDPDKIIR